MAGIKPATSERDLARIVQAVRDLYEGRSHAVSTCTLTAGITSTVVAAENCGPSSQIFLSPKTANAATALATTYVSAVGANTFTLTHANNAQTDRTFGYAIQG